MAFPKMGSKAPAFRLPNQDSQPVRIGDFKGKYLILYFYPKAMTPGCTSQACGLRDVLPKLAELNAIAVGISPDPVARLKKFTEKEALNFCLLSDEDHAVADRYGAWGLKKFMGREFMGLLRTTFIIDPNGHVAAVLDKFKTASHHMDVISWLKEHAKV